jgi:hypothetical protein
VEDDEEPITCTVCGLCVHAGCYGSLKKNRKGSWVCDMCINDKQPLFSTVYPHPSLLTVEIRLCTMFNAGTYKGQLYRTSSPSATLETYCQQ